MIRATPVPALPPRPSEASIEALTAELRAAVPGLELITATQPAELARLSRELPDAVDRYTPEGRMPDDDGQDAGASDAVTRADATGDEATPARTIENPLKGMAPTG